MWILSSVALYIILINKALNPAPFQFTQKFYFHLKSHLICFYNLCFFFLSPAPLSSAQVAWLRSSEHKFFEYIHRRNPPFRNFSTPGADIDVSINFNQLPGALKENFHLFFFSWTFFFCCCWFCYLQLEWKQQINMGMEGRKKCGWIF